MLNKWSQLTRSRKEARQQDGGDLVAQVLPSNTRILVVEDNSEDQTIISRALSNFGAKDTTLAVASGEAALEAVQIQDFDAALIDYNLPGMNGLRVVEQIRECSPNTLQIMITGARDDQVAASALKLGAVDYLAKDDFMTGSVIRSLTAALRKRSDEQRARKEGVVSSGTGKLDSSIEGTGWLAESLMASGGLRVADSAPREPEDEEWLDLVETFRTYIVDCFANYPTIEVSEEASLVEKFMYRGSTPPLK